eukprot:gene26351-31833_t
MADHSIAAQRILRKLRDGSSFTLNPALLRLKDLLHKSIDADIATVSDDVLLSNILMLLTNIPMDANSLLSEQDDGIVGSIGMTNIPLTTTQGSGVSQMPTAGQGAVGSIASYPPTLSPRDTSAPAKQSVEQRFWALVMTLFLNVCAPHSQCKDSVNVIEDIVKLLDSQECKQKSPALILAADVCIQRAIYELSDKLPRHSSSSTPTPTPRDSPPYTINNIERCASAMTHLFLPLCAKLTKLWGLPMPSHNTPQPPSQDSPLALGSRVGTLNRQLQELMAWTKYEGQHRVPALFPTPPSSTAQTTNTSPNPTPRIAAPPLTIHAQSSPHLSPRVSVGDGVCAIYDEVLTSVLQDLHAHIPTESAHTHTHSSASSVYVDSVCKKIHALLSPGVEVYAVGSASIHLAPLVEGGLDCDVIALLPPHLHAHLHPSPTSLQTRSLLHPYHHQVESVCGSYVAKEGMGRHLKAVFKDTVHAINAFIEAVTNISNSSIGDVYSMFHASNVHNTVSLLRQEAESLLQIGEEMLHAFTSVHSSSSVMHVHNNPHSQQPHTHQSILIYLTQLQDQLDRSNREHGILCKKVVKGWEKLLRDGLGMYQVKVLFNKTRFCILKGLVNNSMLNSSSSKGNDRTVCSLNVYVDSMVPFYTSKLIHNEYVPNIHSMLYDCAGMGKAVDYSSFFASLPTTLPTSYLQKLHNTSVFQLLDLFSRYFVESMDIFQGVVTLRGKGEVSTKLGWENRTSVLWRLAVEDPFPCEYGGGVYDLGSSLSRSGQLTTFKALRRAVYGLYAIANQGMETCRANFKKLFNRKADYMGASVLPPPAHSRSIFSPHYLVLDSTSMGVSCGVGSGLEEEAEVERLVKELSSLLGGLSTSPSSHNIGMGMGMGMGMGNNTSGMGMGLGASAALPPFPSPRGGGGRGVGSYPPPPPPGLPLSSPRDYTSPSASTSTPSPPPPTTHTHLHNTHAHAQKTSYAVPPLDLKGLAGGSAMGGGEPYGLGMGIGMGMDSSLGMDNSSSSIGDQGAGAASSRGPRTRPVVPPIPLHALANSNLGVENSGMEGQMGAANSAYYIGNVTTGRSDYHTTSSSRHHTTHSSPLHTPRTPRTHSMQQNQHGNAHFHEASGALSGRSGYGGVVYGMGMSSPRDYGMNVGMGVNSGGMGIGMGGVGYYNPFAAVGGMGNAMGNVGDRGYQNNPNSLINNNNTTANNNNNASSSLSNTRGGAGEWMGNVAMESPRYSMQPPNTYSNNTNNNPYHAPYHSNYPTMAHSQQYAPSLSVQHQYAHAYSTPNIAAPSAQYGGSEDVNVGAGEGEGMPDMHTWQPFGK